jgi:hypothetical protein
MSSCLMLGLNENNDNGSSGSKSAEHSGPANLKCLAEQYKRQLCI